MGILVNFLKQMDKGKVHFRVLAIPAEEMMWPIDPALAEDTQ